MLLSLTIIVGGILAASSLIIARKPNARALIDKLTPYQGYCGVAMVGCGVWTLIDILRFFSVLKAMPLTLVFLIAGTVVCLIVGFLLGFGLITTWTLKGSPDAMRRGQALRERLAPKQGLFGLLAIAIGVINLVLVVTH